MSQSTLLTFFGKSKKPLGTNEKRKTNPIGSEESAKAARKAFLDQLFGEDNEKEDILIDESDDNLSQNSKDANAELENVDSNSKQGNEASIEKIGPIRKFRHEWVSKNPFLLHIVRNRVEFMKCAWCEKYKVKGPWGKGNGCKSIMKSAIRKHKKSREHAWAAARFHHEGGKHLKEHAKVVLNRNMHKVITCMKLAYFNAKEDLAVRKYEKLCELAYVLELISMPVKHEYGTYTNMMAGKEFIFSISQYLENIQKTQILHSPFYGLMVDETTDKGLEKHLIIYVSFLALEGKGMCTTQFARLLAVPDGCAQTKFDAIMKFLDERGLDKQRMVGIATDGDSSMLGCHDGLVAKLRREVPHLTSIHCIAHREALAVVDAAKSFACLSYIDKIANKIYSWISASSLRHSEFQNLLQEMNLQILEVLQIFDVRWLSQGNVMERLTQLMLAILSFWRTSAPSWYDKLRVYKVLFCIYMLADVLKELNKLSVVFQKDTLDISSISSSIENVLSGLRRKFLGEHFHKDSVYLKKFMESTNDDVLRHVNDCGEEYAHVLLYTSIPGKDKSGIPLDLDTGDVASCVNLARMFVQKVIECVNERFPDVYFFNAARLFVHDIILEMQSFHIVQRKEKRKSHLGLKGCL